MKMILLPQKSSLKPKCAYFRLFFFGQHSYELIFCKTYLISRDAPPKGPTEGHSTWWWKVKKRSRRRVKAFTQQDSNPRPFSFQAHCTTTAAQVTRNYPRNIAPEDPANKTGCCFITPTPEDAADTSQVEISVCGPTRQTPQSEEFWNQTLINILHRKIEGKLFRQKSKKSFSFVLFAQNFGFSGFRFFEAFKWFDWNSWNSDANDLVL